jgi:hypothetical protein
MAEVLCVYREVAVLRACEAVQPNVAIISYDDQPAGRSMPAVGRNFACASARVRPTTGQNAGMIFRSSGSRSYFAIRPFTSA